jgi:hypothetical protein
MRFNHHMWEKAFDKFISKASLYFVPFLKEFVALIRTDFYDFSSIRFLFRKNNIVKIWYILFKMQIYMSCKWYILMNFFLILDLTILKGGSNGFPDFRR